MTDLLITMNFRDHALAHEHRLGKTVVKVPGVGVDFPKLEARRTGAPQRLRESLGIGQDAFVLIYPAEFSRRKQQRLLLYAMTRLPESTVLVLPGAGEERSGCQALARSLGISHRVSFPGYVADMVPYFEMADAAVSASRSEGLPFHIMEAMYFGLPVVASDVKGNQDLIYDQHTGLLYPQSDASACAAQISRLREDPNFALHLSLTAKQQVSQYSLSNVQPRVMELYHRILEWSDSSEGSVSGL